MFDGFALKRLSSNFVENSMAGNQKHLKNAKNFFICVISICIESILFAFIYLYLIHDLFISYA